MVVVAVQIARNHARWSARLLCFETDEHGERQARPHVDLDSGRVGAPSSWSLPMIRKTRLRRDGQDDSRSGRVAPERRSRRLGRSSARLATGADVVLIVAGAGLQKRHSASRPQSDHRPSPGRVAATVGPQTAHREFGGDR
jgi:hypothetical protein